MERVSGRRFVEAPRRAPLTDHQRIVLGLYVELGSHKAVAHALRVSLEAVKRTFARVRARLGVDSTIQAYAALGWLRVPA